MRAPPGDGGQHGAQEMVEAGAAIEKAAAAVIVVHGRGGSAGDILGLAANFEYPDLAWLAPQAKGNSWYPYSFLAPLEHNQPRLGAALDTIAGSVRDLADRGLGAERLALVGFSQGACLALEFAARHPRRYGAIAALTGGLVGPPGTPRDYPGSLQGTPVLLASGDPDPHVPWERVEETAAVLERMGAMVDLRRYPGMAHTINNDELEALDRMLAALVGGARGRE